MLANRTIDYRRHGIQLVSLLLVVSFAFIPVRCDASAAPHSIFVPATMVHESAGHPHHATSATNTKPAKMVPHHSPAEIASAHVVAGHQHAQTNASPNHAATASDDPTQRCLVILNAGTDLQTQQPVGGTLDLPTTSVTPDSTSLQPVPGESLGLTFAPAAILSGISAPPDAPPPKTA